MTTLYPGLYATPFHPRMANYNIYNAWAERGAFTVPRHFGNVAREALAARFSAVLADISASGRLRIHGAGTARLLSAAFKVDLTNLPAGEGSDVFWLSDGGGVRGIGVAARFGEENFLLEAADTDADWFSGVASRFDAKVRDERAEKGVLLVAGPFAAAILMAAGLGAATALGARAHGIFDLRGITVTVARRALLSGYELTCSRDDSLALFDHVNAAGKPYGLTLIGQDALDLLRLEAGIPIAGRDYRPVRTFAGTDPHPASLGLTPPEPGQRILAGVEWEGECTFAQTLLYRDGREAGRMMRAAYSHALGRMVALANIDSELAGAGTALTMRSSGAVGDGDHTVSVVTLPFLNL